VRDVSGVSVAPFFCLAVAAAVGPPESGSEVLGQARQTAKKFRSGAGAKPGPSTTTASLTKPVKRTAVGGGGLAK